MALWGYGELDALIAAHPNVKNGLLIDTNILVAATYELDKFHEPAMDLIDALIGRSIPLFCNVNIRAEFLDIHRRIIFSEGIIGFERVCEKALLPPDLAGDLSTYRRRYEQHEKNKPEHPPLRLNDFEIKNFRGKMLQVRGANTDLWSELIVHQVSTKISDIWKKTEDRLGLNFLSLRKEDQERHLNRKPDWDDVEKLMSNPGLSSSDAMIVNMFFASKFEVIASSDADIAIALQRSGLRDKHCLIPDDLKENLASTP